MKKDEEVIICKKGETVYLDLKPVGKTVKDTQFKHSGVNKRGFSPLKKRGDN